MDQSRQLTARHVIAQSTEKELAHSEAPCVCMLTLIITVFKTWGEEPHAKAVARAIVQAREDGPIESTAQLAGIIGACSRHRNKRTHPATLSFQVCV